MDVNASEEYAASIFRVELSVVRKRPVFVRKMAVQIHGREKRENE
jgi:hypothetical protein